MRLKDHALSIVFAVAFLAALVGQSFAGLADFNEEQLRHGAATSRWFDFVTSSDFIVDVAENWQSEYLQFFLFILATVWFVQRGSPESKRPGDEGPGSDEDQLVGAHARPDSPGWAKRPGWRLALYGNSLLLTMGAIFLASWVLQAMAGVTVANDERLLHGQAELGFLEYLASPDFWNRTLQNWQSELLAVGSMVAFSIFLRQRGSAESKPVGTPHDESAVESE
ncbi:hypothetical protein MUN78_10830 [Leucobacter allii]|uniref:Uncharacterized protein n=1 Tax=Leucobacter allii TaxID=2932247 RepID=A0ABY4FJL0_9MICO|nr:DUF6766 family protein [Leucobacter allii]UOQ56187.1 hypothetical protein MUN78_10830 [Leucobacter allii]UOR00655.1 hypothetical protein MUN77_10835 [Leucobacter allii]